MKGPGAGVTSTRRDRPRTLRMPDGTWYRDPPSRRPGTTGRSARFASGAPRLAPPQDQEEGTPMTDPKPQTTADALSRVAAGRADRRGRQARPDRGRGRRVGRRGGRAGGPCHRRGRPHGPQGRRPRRGVRGQDRQGGEAGRADGAGRARGLGDRGRDGGHRRGRCPRALPGSRRPRDRPSDATRSSHSATPLQSESWSCCGIFRASGPSSSRYDRDRALPGAAGRSADPGHDRPAGRAARRSEAVR